jgi:predicted phage terminase large subunit-like protein
MDLLERTAEHLDQECDRSEVQSWATAGQLARAIDPTTVQTPALDLIDAALVDVAEGRCDRLIISMPPQEGKSTRVTTVGPLWMLTRNPDLRIAIVSYGQDLADEFGRNIRNHITSNSGEDGELDLGLRIAPDNGAARRWRIAGRRGGVRSVGITAGLTGRPADILYIDDPIKDEAQAQSPTWRERVWNFWLAVGNTRLAPGAPVILILTRWHEDDLAGRMLAAADGHRWRVINIPAQADHDPNKGQSDPLGRPVGEFLASARKRTREQWEQIKTAVGSRVWNALYQGRPAPAEGTLFKRGDWQYFSPALVRCGADGAWRADSMDEIIQSWDLTFKDVRGSDYVVGQVWGRRGADVFLLDQVRDRLDFPATCKAFEALTSKWPQANGKLVEDKANGPAVIAQLRSRVPGLIAITPKDSKYARASSVAPFVEAHNVYLPDPASAPWVAAFIEEHASFPNAAHDDQVDTMSQAVSRMLGDQGSPEQAMEWLRGFAAA